MSWDLRIAVIDKNPLRAAVLEEGLCAAGHTSVVHIDDTAELLERILIFGCPWPKVPAASVLTISVLKADAKITTRAPFTLNDSAARIASRRSHCLISAVSSRMDD